MTRDAIKQVRLALKEDTDTFGQRFGRSGRTVESWEQGKRSPDPLVLKELSRIVKARKIDVREEKLS